MSTDTREALAAQADSAFAEWWNYIKPGIRFSRTLIESHVFAEGYMQGHRAALATQPAQVVPLTEHELWANDDLMAINAEAGFKMQDIIKIARAIERTHGIVPKTTMEEDFPLREDEC